eukprot:5257004-Prymnesium_polylepis.1
MRPRWQRCDQTLLQLVLAVAVLTPKCAGLHERALASQSRTTAPHCRELSLSGSVGVQPLSSFWLCLWRFHSM